MGSRWRLPKPWPGGRRPRIRCGYCGGSVYVPKARFVRVRGLHTYVCGHHPQRPGE